MFIKYLKESLEYQLIIFLFQMAQYEAADEEISSHLIAFMFYFLFLLFALLFALLLYVYNY